MLPQRAIRKIRWSYHPEMVEFMRENDTGTIEEISERFESEYGFPLARSQVTLFRQLYGNVSRESITHAREYSHAVPIGAMRYSKGRLIVKLSMMPSKSGTKDNWRQLHVLAYESFYGPVPDGHVVVACDKNPCNVAKENLIAIPRNLVGVINEIASDYHDRRSLELAIAQAKLRRALVDVGCRERRCCICGKEFAPRNRTSNGANVKTCPECVDAGHKPTHEHQAQGKYKLRCKVCGKEFMARKKSHHRCRECIDQLPAYSWKSHRRYNENHGIYTCPLGDDEQ